MQFVEASIDDLPFDDGSFDVVISNGVINLSPVKDDVFAEAARVLRPGGRLAIADIVSATPLKESTRRNTELWAACIAGAIPSTAYLDAARRSRLRDHRHASERLPVPQRPGPRGLPDLRRREREHRRNPRDPSTRGGIR